MNNMQSPQPVELAGIKVIPFANKQQLLNTVFSCDGKIIPGVAVAVNPEKVIKAIEDDETRTIINNATVQYADGIGVVKALERKLSVRLDRIAGCELWLDILEYSKAFNSKVVLIGAKETVVAHCEQLLINQGINIVSARNGYLSSYEPAQELMKQYRPDIVIIAQGSPRQEKLIEQLRKEHPNAFYMGVGGSFDVLAGEVKRAPAIWQRLNLEWLYRVVKEPKRLFRQANLFRFLIMHWRGKL